MYALNVDKMNKNLLERRIVLDREYLLGSVGPGTSANHLSKTTKFCAMVLYTGMRSWGAKVILSPARVRLVVPMAVSCSWRKPSIVSAAIIWATGKLSSGWKVEKIWKATPVTEWLGSSGDTFPAVGVAQTSAPVGSVTLA